MCSIEVTQMLGLCDHQVCDILTFTDIAAINGTEFEIRTQDNGTELGSTSPNKSVKAVNCLKFTFIAKMFLRLVPLTAKKLFHGFTMCVHHGITSSQWRTNTGPSIPFPFQMSTILLHCPLQHSFCELRKRRSFSLLLQEQLSILRFTLVILLCTYSILIHFSC